MFGKRRFIMDFYDEMTNASKIHTKIICKLEEKYERNIIFYYGNFEHSEGHLLDIDVDFLENIIRSVEVEKYDRKISLIVHSPGGHPYAAGKMVHTCNTFSNNDFTAIVLGRAMSAATLLCLGAKELIMSETACIGPIDPQMLTAVPNHGQRWVPAHIIISSIQMLVSDAQNAIAQKRPHQPFMDILRTMDMYQFRESHQAILSTKKIAATLLSGGLLRSANKKMIEKVIEELIDQGVEEQHGKYIYLPDVRKIGLPANTIELGSEEDWLFRELFVRVQHHANQAGVAKCFVTREGAVNVSIERHLPPPRN